MTDDERARLAHPHSESHQAKWIAAIKTLRTTKQGWCLESGPHCMVRYVEPEPVPPKASKVVPIRRQK